VNDLFFLKKRALSRMTHENPLSAHFLLQTKKPPPNVLFQARMKASCLKKKRKSPASARTSSSEISSSETTEIIRLQVVDDHPSIHMAIKAILSESPYEIVASARSVQEAITQHKDMAFDAIILDLFLPEQNGEALLHYHREQATGIPILLFTGTYDPERIYRCMNNGAMGCVLKLSPLDEFREALDSIARQKKTYISKSIPSLPSSDHETRPPATLHLSPREIEIARCIARSLSNKEISEHLKIGMSTVNTHRTNLMRKLNAKDSAAVTRYAINQGLI
jgi:DNA-binding NarL/FixJ family response regulator